MHLLVDGWNAIYANPKLKIILQEHSQESAVKALCDIVVSIHDFENCRTTIVFDGKGSDIEIVRDSKIKTFSQVYTPTEMTADDFIEQYCAQHPEDCTVATADNLLDLTAGFFGANIISPVQLFEWAKQCSQNIRNKSSQNQKQNSISWKQTNPFIGLKIKETAPVEKPKILQKAEPKQVDAKKKAKTVESKKEIAKKAFPWLKPTTLSWKKSLSELELSVEKDKKNPSKKATWADTNPFLALNIKNPKTNKKKNAKK